MKKEINKTFRVHRTISLIIMLLGGITLIYMIAVEDEPGALPLLLIILGAVWTMIIQYQIKKQVRTK